MDNISIRKQSIPSPSSEGSIQKRDGIPKVIVTKEAGSPEQPVLIRKTSIRRRLSKDESPKTPEVKYGIMFEEYDNIRDRMMADKGVQNTIEALEERWRMIMFMYEDCVSMLESKLERDRKRRKIQQKYDLIALAIVYGCMSVPFMIMLLIVYLFIIFF